MEQAHKPGRRLFLSETSNHGHQLVSWTDEAVTLGLNVEKIHAGKPNNERRSRGIREQTIDKPIERIIN